MKWSDVGVSAALAVTMAVSISAGLEESSRDPDFFAYALGVAVALVLPLRRRWPLGAVAATIAVLMVYYSLDYPAFPPALPLAAASYYAALAGRLIPAAALVGVFVAFGTYFRVVEEGTSLEEVLGSTTLPDAALLAAVLLLGDSIRSRRAWAEEVRERMQRDIERRLEDQRLRIARELHDVMAHTITGVSVQASVAADVIDDDPEQAKTALEAIRSQSGEALSELRAAVGLLRAGEAPRDPAPGLDELDGLVARTGLDVELDVTGEPRALPKAIELTAYRIVQESLTNVVRHARASSARVQLSYGQAGLDVEVTDDGVAANGSEPGFGLAGMRERAEAVGGTLEAGRAPGGGFRVHAHLPTR